MAFVFTSQRDLKVEICIQKMRTVTSFVRSLRLMCHIIALCICITCHIKTTGSLIDLRVWRPRLINISLPYHPIDNI